MTEDEASAAIIAMVTGRIIAIEIHPDGGWLVEMEGIERGAVFLLENHEVFHYAHIDTFYDNDIPYYREAVMLATHDDPDGTPMVIMEGLYQRELRHEDRPNARFEGRILFLEAEADLAGKTAMMHRSFSERALRAYAECLAYVRDNLRTIAYHLEGTAPADGLEALRKTVSEMNRDVAGLEERNAA